MKEYISHQVFLFYRCMILLNTPAEEAFQLTIQLKRQLEKKYNIQL